ncbi:hypothetical protein IWW50_002186, partial [Coemansia erecta]
MLSVLGLLVLALAVPVKANTSVSDMDLLSGAPTVLAAVAAFIQILPSPVKVFRGRVTHFVEWLQRNIETDFDVSLYSCTKKCMTQTYDANLEAIERRVRVNSGVADTVGCAGTALLTTEEAVAIIQNGSGRTLMCLARAARYPYVDRLETAVRVIRHAPMSGRRVIFWQWAAMSVPYFFSWCFRHGLPRWFYWAFLILRNILRRWRRLMPRERQRSGKINIEYRMAALARHKMDAQHVPFVRFALYVMLMLESGKYVSIRKGVANNTDKQRPADADSNWQLGNEEKFRHPCIDARTLALRVATDECSAVRLLYASALHSMRVVLLGQQHQGGYAPPYVVTSSFRAAICHLQNTMLVVSHGSIDTVFQCLLQGKARGHFDLLLKHMQSRLGSHVLRKTECQILLNIALLPLELRVIAPKDNVGPSTQPSRVPTTYEVDGKVILPEQYKQLCRAQCTLLEELDTELENFASPDLYWGPHPWLLRMLFISISRANAFDVDKGCKDKYKFVKLLRVKIKMLCFSPYQLRFGLESNETLDDFYELGTKFGNEDELDSPEFCRSMPAWCLCTSHCRGICTLIVNELEMKIVVKGYFNQPYLFTATSDPEKPPPTKDGNSISANSGESSIRLIGAFGGLANDDFSYDSYSENAKDADAVYEDLYTNKRSKLLITGCAGVGKSCILRELHVRALWASTNVRVVVIDDYYAWSKMTDSNALGHLLVQIMVGFAEVEHIASEFELESWEVEDSEARCAQLLQKIHDYCVGHGVGGIPLKIIFIVDNYCKVDGGSVAHKFINGPVQTHNKTMLVVAATSDSKVVENDNSEYKIPTGYSMTEAVVVITDLLIPGKDKLVKLWNRRRSSILSVVQRSTLYNPFEMGALFEYVGDTGTMAKFVKKAADFVHDFNDAKKLPKLGAKFKRTMAENNNSGGGGGEPITDIEDLSRKLIFQAYFQLQSMSPASRTNGDEQKAFFECHPFISSGSKDTSVGSKKRGPYRFSTPRAGNYVFRHAFGKDFPGREISKLYGMDDASRYDLAYAALKWLYGTAGFTIDNEENKSTLYELHGTEQKQIGVELVNLKSTELEPNTNAQLVYSHPCYTYAMNSTGGLDFGFRLANGFSVMEYIVVMMFGDDENVEDAVEELKTWNSYKNYSGAISPMSPHKRVLSGISSANYYKNAQREK